MKNGRTSRETASGSIEVIGAMTLAGSTVTVGKMMDPGLSVPVIGALSLFFALLVMLPLQVLRWKELARLTRRELGFMALQALFGIVLFRAFVLAGLRFTGAMEAGILLSLSPLAMSLAGRIFLGERPTPRRLLGVSLSFLAVLVMNVCGLSGEARSGEGFAGRLLGNLCILGAVGSESMLTIFRKRSGGAIGSLTNTTVLSALALLMFAPFAVLSWAKGEGGALSGTDILCMMYYGIFGTGLAYILWGDGSLKVPAAVTGAAMAAMPLSSFLLAWGLLGERARFYHVFGCLAAAGGILVGAWEPRRAKLRMPGGRPDDVSGKSI